MDVYVYICVYIYECMYQSWGAFPTIWMPFAGSRGAWRQQISTLSTNLLGVGGQAQPSHPKANPHFVVVGHSLCEMQVMQVRTAFSSLSVFVRQARTDVYLYLLFWSSERTCMAITTLPELSERTCIYIRLCLGVRTDVYGYNDVARTVRTDVYLHTSLSWCPNGRVWL